MKYCHLALIHGDHFVTSPWWMADKFIWPSCENQRCNHLQRTILTLTKFSGGEIYFSTWWLKVEGWGILSHALKLRYLKLFLSLSRWVKPMILLLLIGFITEKIYWIIYCVRIAQKYRLLPSGQLGQSGNQFTSKSTRTLLYLQLYQPSCSRWHNVKYNCRCFHWPHLHVIHFVQWIDEMLHNSDVNRDKNILLILFLSW